jgi:hypothetical protein
MCKNHRFIEELARAKTREKCKSVLRHGGRKEITALAEVAKNVLGNRIQLSKRQKRQLCCKKRIIRRLASRLTTYPQKKRLVQKGGFAVAASILASAAIPYIIEAIRKARQ